MDESRASPHSPSTAMAAAAMPAGAYLPAAAAQSRPRRCAAPAGGTAEPEAGRAAAGGPAGLEAVGTAGPEAVGTAGPEAVGTDVPSGSAGAAVVPLCPAAGRDPAE